LVWTPLGFPDGTSGKEPAYQEYSIQQGSHLFERDTVLQISKS